MHGFLKNWRKFFFLVSFISCTALYVGNIAYEKYMADNARGIKGIVSDHLAGLNTSHREIRGLVLGGSNALFGISAEQLSNTTKIDFFNLSLISEGYNLDNYDAHLADAAKFVDGSKIEFVLWSPIKIYRFGESQRQSKDLFGNTDSYIFPNNSILKNIYLWILARAGWRTNNVYRVSGDYGDFDFSSFECNNRLDWGDQVLNLNIAAYFQSVGEIVRKNFPNARTLIVAPSVFNKPNLNNNDEEAFRLAADDAGMMFAFQSGIPSPELLCDAGHHPNSIGRRWRTDELGKIVLQNFGRERG